jgi:hypothetical protein
MLISSYSKYHKNRLALLAFSLASLFMFALVSQVQAKSISLGTTTDIIYTGGSFGIGTGLVGANEKLRIEVPDGYWGLQFTRSGNPVGGIYTNTGNLYLENATGAQLNLNGTNIGVAGNLGIGTSTPLYKLQVVGTSYLNGQITTALSGTGNRCVYVDSTGNLAAKTTDCGTATGGDNLGDHIATQNIQLGAYWLSGDGGNEGVFVNSLGNVGIGQTNPITKLDISGTLRNTLATTHSLLGGGGEVLVMADNSGNLYATSTAGFLGGSGTSLWGGTLNGSIWNGDAGAGNVGIGITNPLHKLSVAGTSYLNGQISTALSGTGNRCVYVDATGNLLAKTADCGTATGGDNLGDHIATQNIRLGNYWLSGDGGNEGIFVNSTGSIGIGTSTPAYPLDVVGQIKSRFSNTGNATGIIIGNNGSEQPQVLFNVSDNSARFKMQVNSVNSANERLSIYAGPLNSAATYETLVVGGNGNVGIGATNPQGKMEIIKNTVTSWSNSELDWALRITDGTQDTGLLFGVASGLDSAAIQSLDPLTSWTTRPLLLNPNGGNVGIGTTSPLYKLDVAGDVNVTGTFRINGTAISSSQWTTNGTSIYYNTGNVGVGITAPVAKLDVSGSLRNSLATTHSLLGGAGNVYVAADNTGALYQGMLSEVSSALYTNGGRINKRTAVANVNYTALAADYIIAYTSLTANRVVTLPTALCASGREFVIVNETSSAYSVIIDPEGTATIAGQASISLGANNATPAYCNGTNWFIY